jgi:hypothetical protein
MVDDDRSGLGRSMRRWHGVWRGEERGAPKLGFAERWSGYSI